MLCSASTGTGSAARCRPRSAGSARLRSADPRDKLAIDPGFLTAQRDTQTLLDGIALVREILAHPAVAPEITAELEPGPDTFSPERIKAELPRRACTVYHPVGTCRMGSDERAVVDPELRVRGVAGLRVADASIMPRITGGNTNAPTIMIGELASDLIRGRRLGALEV